MKNNAFSSYHPVAAMLFFVLVIGCAVALNHPLCLAVSFFCALGCSFCLAGKKTLRLSLFYMLPLSVVSVLINVAFNHRGATVLGYFGNGNPLTLESLLSGVFSAFLLVTVVLWFGCFNSIITSDKLIYLFGRVAPALSLLLSMSLRFVPRFAAQAKTIADAQRCLGRGISSGRLLQRAGNGIKILSILTTWALENAIDTADSMKSRGYGLPGRSAFSVYRFEKRDKNLIVFLLLCGGFVIGAAASGQLKFTYYPRLSVAAPQPLQICLLAAYFALCIVPVLINAKEELRWKITQSRIFAA